MARYGAIFGTDKDSGRCRPDYHEGKGTLRGGAWGNLPAGTGQGPALKIDAQNELDHAAARIVRRRKILVSARGLPEERAVDAEGGHVGRGASDKEVDIVERIQELGPELDVCGFIDKRALDDAEIRACETRTRQKDMSAELTWSARRRDVLAGWRSGNQSHRLYCVVDRVLWEEIDATVFLADRQSILKLIDIESREYHSAVVLVVRRATAREQARPPGVDSGRSVEGPPFHQLV